MTTPKGGRPRKGSRPPLRMKGKKPSRKASPQGAYPEFEPSPLVEIPPDASPNLRAGLEAKNEHIRIVNEAKARARAELERPPPAKQLSGIPHEWHAEASQLVKLGVAAGRSQAAIAALIPRYSPRQLATMTIPPADGTRRGIDVSTLKRNYAVELETGQNELIVKATQNLIRLAMQGLLPGTTHDRSTLGALMFFLRNRGGAAWQEPTDDGSADTENPERGQNRKLTVSINIGTAPGKTSAEEMAAAEAAARELRQRAEADSDDA